VDPERFARFTTIAQRIDAACARSPVLVVIDDIHAADAGAMLLSRFVARTLAWRPLVLLLTRRTEPDDADEVSLAWPYGGAAGWPKRVSYSTGQPQQPPENTTP
jgi:hypothetical protein